MRAVPMKIAHLVGGDYHVLGIDFWLSLRRHPTGRTNGSSRSTPRASWFATLRALAERGEVKP